MANNKTIQGGENTVRVFEFKKGKMSIKWDVDIMIKTDLRDSIDVVEKLAEVLKVKLKELQNKK